MPIRIADGAEVSAVYIGGQSVDKLYIGTDEVWSAAEPSIAAPIASGPRSGRTGYVIYNPNQYPTALSQGLHWRYRRRTRVTQAWTTGMSTEALNRYDVGGPWFGIEGSTAELQQSLDGIEWSRSTIVNRARSDSTPAGTEPTATIAVTGSNAVITPGTLDANQQGWAWLLRRAQGDTDLGWLHSVGTGSVTFSALSVGSYNLEVVSIRTPPLRALSTTYAEGIVVFPATPNSARPPAPVMYYDGTNFRMMNPTRFPTPIVPFFYQWERSTGRTYTVVSRGPSGLAEAVLGPPSRPGRDDRYRGIVGYNRAGQRTSPTSLTTSEGAVPATPAAPSARGRTTGTVNITFPALASGQIGWVLLFRSGDNWYVDYHAGRGPYTVRSVADGTYSVRQRALSSSYRVSALSPETTITVG